VGRRYSNVAKAAGASMNDSMYGERQHSVGEPPLSGGAATPRIAPAPNLALLPDEGHRGTRMLRRVPVFIILLFWVAQFSNLTAMRLMRFPEEGFEAIVPRIIVTLFGIAWSFGFLAIQRAARRRSFTTRSVIAALIAPLGSALHTLTNLLVFRAFFPDAMLMLSTYLPAFFDWMWFYAALSVVILALTYVADLADKEERIASLQARANAFQLRALRYQLNPHFLFNTLNSIASLISRRKNPEAEAMVVSLSDFLRSTLKIDPGVEITLGEEIALQSLYLDIERFRFPHRLRVNIDVPDDLRDACVPNLILQPLIENAIKHGVAQSSKEVHLEILAGARNGRLQIEVRDDGGDAPAARNGGANVGLANVADRLRVHFAEAAELAAEQRPGGGFSARISMPLRLAA
jgi:two-component system LytT family sensor kinase